MMLKKKKTLLNLFRVLIKKMDSPLLVFFTNNQKALAILLAGDNTQQGQEVWILVNPKQAD